KVTSYWDGNIPWASVKDFQDDIQLLNDTIERISSEGLKKSASNLIPPDVLLICVRMAIGRVAITTQPTAINQDIKALYTNDFLLPKYLLYLIRIHRPKLEALSIGSTVKGLSLSQLLSLSISVPLPSVQRHIANILDTIDEQIQHTEQLIAKIKLQRAGLLRKLLTCGIGEHGHLRAISTSSTSPSQKIELKSFPNEWEIHPLSKIAEIGAGLTLGKKFSGADIVTLPYLRVANVQDGYLDLTDMKT